MSEINKNDLISEEALKAPLELANNLDKALSVIRKLISEGKEASINIGASKSINELSVETKKLQKSQELLDKSNKSIANSTKDVNNINKEAIKLEAQLGKLSGEQAKENSILQQQIAKRKEELKKAAKETLGLNTEVKKLSKEDKELLNLTDKLSKSESNHAIATEKLKLQIAEKNKKVKNAAKETLGLNKEVKKLSKEDRELLSLTNKLSKSESKHANATEKLKLEIAEKNKRVKQSVRDSLGLVSAYEKENQKLNKLKSEYRELALTQGLSTKATKQKRIELQKLDQKLKQVDASSGQFNRNVGNYPKTFSTAIAGITGFAFAIVGVVRAIGRSIKITRDYQDANATLAAILGTTADKTVLLRRQQLALGESTEFSASQVAKAQTELARLGKTEKEIIDMTPGILFAATSLKTDLASAAELVAGQLNAFGLAASESGRVSDVLTKSTQISALNFERLSTSLGIVSPAAKAVGSSLERTTAILGAAVDANIDASTAATALRNIYIDLAESGLTFEEAMEKISTSTNKLSTANELFGKRGAVVASVIADQTDKINKNTKALNNAAGTAEKFAKNELNTLSGDIKLLVSAWEGFVLSIENGNGVIMRSLRAIISGFTTLLGHLTEDLPEAENALVSINKEFNRQIIILKQGNLTSEARNELISEMNDSYGDYLPNLITEQNSLEELDVIQKKVNQNIFNRILLAKQEEEISEIINNILEAEKSLLEIELQREDALIRLRNAQSGQQAKAIQSEIETLNNLYGLNKSIIEENNIELDNLNNSYEELSKRLGLNNSSIGRNVKSNQSVSKSLKKVKEDVIDVTENYKFLDWVIKNLPKNEDISAKAAEDSAKRRKKASDEEFKKIAENLAKEAKLREELERFKSETIMNLEMATFNLSNTLFDRKSENIEAETRLIDENLEKRLTSLEGNEEGQALAIEQAEQRKEQLRRESIKNERRRAVVNRAFAIGEVIQNTAAAITKAISLSPLTGGLPWSGIAAVAGALQTASIVAQPLPQYATGVYKLNGEGTETSDSIVARLSKNESVVPAAKTKEFGSILKPMIEDPTFNMGKLKATIMAGVDPKYNGNLFQSNEQELKELRAIKNAVSSNKSYTTYLDGKQININLARRNSIKAKIERRNRY